LYYSTANQNNGNDLSSTNQIINSNAQRKSLKNSIGGNKMQEGIKVNYNAIV